MMCIKACFLLLSSIPLCGCITVYSFSRRRTFGLLPVWVCYEESCNKHSGTGFMQTSHVNTQEEISGSMICICLVSYYAAKLFPKVAIPLCIHFVQDIYERSSFSAFLSGVDIISSFDLGGQWYLIIALIYISLNE